MNAMQLRTNHADHMGGLDMSICEHAMIAAECPFCHRPAKVDPIGHRDALEDVPPAKPATVGNVRVVARRAAREALRAMCRAMPTVTQVIEATGPATPSLLVQLGAAKIERVLVDELGLPAPAPPQCRDCFDEGDPLNGCGSCGLKSPTYGSNLETLARESRE